MSCRLRLAWDTFTRTHPSGIFGSGRSPKIRAAIGSSEWAFWQRDPASGAQARPPPLCLCRRRGGTPPRAPRRSVDVEEGGALGEIGVVGITGEDGAAVFVELCEDVRQRLGAFI